MNTLYETRAALMRAISSRAALAASLSVAALLAGCASMAPDYERPAAPVAAQWPVGAAAAGASSGQALPSWESLFADPGLKRMVRLALDNNRDLRVATLNIEKARAQYHIQRAAQFPEVDASGSGDMGRTPASVSTIGRSYVSRVYGLDVGVSSYELDLFGRVRSLKDQALEQYLSTEATQRATRLSLIAEVATDYLNLVADGEQLALARRTAQTRQQTADLQRRLRDEGVGTDLAVHQAEADLQAARDQTLQRENTVASDRNALELVVGSPLPADFLPDASLESMLAVRDIPAGLPSDLLLRRPDVIAAEHTLKAANANIGAARAAFFPTISLTASFGRTSNALSDLFDGVNRSWSFVPQISVPIFSAGRLQSELDVAKIERDVSVAQYESAIQSAFREVADALASRATLDQRQAALQGEVDASRQAYDLASVRQATGVATYLDVLDAQRTLYSAEQSLLSIRLARQTSLVTLYKAVGGDLQADAERER